MKILSFIEMLTGSQYITNFFQKNNIDTVFGYSGGANLHFLDTLSKSSIQLIVNRHEQFVGHSAEAYARIKNNLGIAITTSGPGITNMITPLQDAMSDSIPLLCISGQVSENNLNTQAFQEVNATALTKYCTKWNTLIKSPNELPQALEYAKKIALEGKKGPVHIDICSNVFSSEISNYEFKNEINFQSEYEYDLNTIKILANMINKASKPVFIIGKGSSLSYPLINFICTNFQIPMTTTLHGLGTVDESLEGSLKMLGMHGSVYANKIVQESDLIVGIGNRFDDRTIGNPKFFGKNAKDNFGIYHIDISQNNIDLVKKIVSPTGSFHMDSNLFFNKLIPFLKFNKNRKKWINHINMYKKKYPLYKKDSKELRCEDILQGLSKKIIGHDFYITTGVGSHQMKVAQHILWNRPNTMISSGSLGTMGVGLPFAIGTHFATPNSTIFCIDGDGSMMMSIQELATIAEYQIPIKILLMNDNSLQMVESWQNIFYKNNIVATNLKNPNFKQLAKSFGIKSIECSSLTSLSKTLDKILSTNEPIFCEFKIKKNFCFPFVKPNHSLDSIMVE